MYTAEFSILKNCPSKKIVFDEALTGPRFESHSAETLLLSLGSTTHTVHETGCAHFRGARDEAPHWGCANCLSWIVDLQMRVLK